MVSLRNLYIFQEYLNTKNMYRIVGLHILFRYFLNESKNIMKETHPENISDIPSSVGTVRK